MLCCWYENQALRATAQQNEDEWWIVHWGETTENRQDRGLLQ